MVSRCSLDFSREVLPDRGAVVEDPLDGGDAPVVGIPVDEAGAARHLLGVAVEQPDPADRARLRQGEGDRLAGGVPGRAPGGRRGRVEHPTGFVGRRARRRGRWWRAPPAVRRPRRCSVRSTARAGLPSGFGVAVVDCAVSTAASSSAGSSSPPRQEARTAKRITTSTTPITQGSQGGVAEAAWSGSGASSLSAGATSSGTGSPTGWPQFRQKRPIPSSWPQRAQVVTGQEYGQDASRFQTAMWVTSASMCRRGTSSTTSIAASTMAPPISSRDRDALAAERDGEGWPRRPAPCS